MKKLTFVRHAKSDWGNEFLKDIDRPLSERGYSDAYFFSDWYLKNHALPDLIVSSTATRALNTALIFARTFNFNMPNFKLEQQMYEASVKTINLVLAELNNKKDSAMFFGHNPGFTNICNELTTDLFFENIPTCGIVSLAFDTDKWSEVSQKKGTVVFHQFPKNFKNND